MKSACLISWGEGVSSTKKLGNRERDFAIAEQDLRIRGPGELLGARQAGSVNFRVADIVRDRELLPNVRTTSLELLRTNRATAQALVRRWLAQPAEYGSA